MRYKDFEIKVERKNNKNMYLRIADEHTILVTCPMRYRDEDIMKFIISKEEWIRKAIVRKDKRMERSFMYRGGETFYYFGEAKILKDGVDVNKVYKDLNKELLKRAEAYIDKYMGMLMDYKYKNRPVLKVRKMTSKWGVCYTRDNSITLNTYLVHYPERCLEYVVLHEMVHFIVPNHSDRFYSLIEMRMKDYKEVKKMLV